MSDRLPLTQHIDTLYPIARVLVGDKTAPRLIRETYRRASTTPVDERPDDVEAWLVQLILEVRAGEGTMPDTEDAGAHDAADTPSLAETRGFRHEVARGVAERALPVALAACSEQERALLTLYVSGTRTNEVLAPIARTIASDIETAIDEAYGELRAALRDILSGPERMLIDTALPDARLEEVLTAYVTDTYHPAPARLRSEVAALVQREAARLRGEDPEAEPLKRDKENGLSVHLRRTGLALLILTVIGAAAYGAAVWLTPASTSEPPSTSVSLTEFSARQMSGVEPLVRSSDPDSIAAVIENRFNRSVRVPSIDGARLMSVGALTVDSAMVPVILYTDTTTTSSITTYVYSYALIDRIEGIGELDDDLASGLDTADSLISRRIDDAHLSLWRHRDDIFVAVAPAAVDSLTARIRPTP